MPFKTLFILAAGFVVALLVGAFTPTARAEPTDVAIIACENLAPYIDGDGNDATTAADLQAACVDALPPTGAVSVAAIDTALGDGDGALTWDEVAYVSFLDNNRIDQSCTHDAVIGQQTKAASGCTLLVFLFVDDEKPVTLDTPAGITSIEAGGLQVDAFCHDGPTDDADCVNVPVGDGDGLVIFRLLNATGVNGDEKTIRVSQEAVEQSEDILLSSATRSDPTTAADPDGDAILTEGGDNCPYVANADQTNTDQQPIVTSGIGPVDTTVPHGDLQGDACDSDQDNDGWLNFQEQIGCSSSPLPTAPLLLDTDGDRVTDGAECALQSDPSDPGSVPAPPAVGIDLDGDGLGPGTESILGSNPNDGDSDDDGIRDGVEYKGYNTSPIAEDTDADGCPDGLEISSLDTNTTVNSNDLLIVAISFASTTRPNMDIDKNGTVNSNDLLTVTLNYDRFCALPD